MLAGLKWYFHDRLQPTVHDARALAERERQRTQAKAAAGNSDEVLALVRLGFTKQAAMACLDASGWTGATLEERITNALKTDPSYAPGRVTG